MGDLLRLCGLSVEPLLPGEHGGELCMLEGCTGVIRTAWPAQVAVPGSEDYYLACDACGRTAKESNGNG